MGERSLKKWFGLGNPKIMPNLAFLETDPQENIFLKHSIFVLHFSGCIVHDDEDLLNDLAWGSGIKMTPPPLHPTVPTKQEYKKVLPAPNLFFYQSFCLCY